MSLLHSALTKPFIGFLLYCWNDFMGICIAVLERRSNKPGQKLSTSVIFRGCLHPLSLLPHFAPVSADCRKPRLTGAAFPATLSANSWHLGRRRARGLQSSALTTHVRAASMMMLFA